MNKAVVWHFRVCLVIGGLFLVSPPGVGALAQGSPSEGFDAVAFCAKKPSLHALVRDVFPHAEKRRSLAAHLLSPETPARAGGSGAQESGCMEPLREALAGLASGKPSAVVKENRVGFLLMGAETKHPGLAPALEASLSAERGAPEWISLLLESNAEAGLAALRTWFAQTAKGLRAAQKLPPLAPDLYGKAASAPDSKGLDDVRLMSPLLFDMYLVELRKASAAGKQMSADDMASLLVVYALQNAGARRLQQASFADVVRLNEGAFLQAFRREHPLLQFRLLPSLAASKTPSGVRELLWISSHHRDVRVKSLASSLLDENASSLPTSREISPEASRKSLE